MADYVPNAVLAVICLVLALRNFQGKGIPLNNSVLYMSEEERSRTDLRPYYRQSGIVFVLLFIANVLLALGSQPAFKWGFAAGMIVIAAAAVYAVASSVRMERRKP